MNLETIDIVKISDSNYKIYQLDKNAGKRNILKFELDGVSSPFGLEEFIHMYYINWEIDNPTLSTFKQLELEFKDMIIQSNPKYKSWSFVSNLKEKKNFEPLIKTRVPQLKGKFIVETKTSLFEIDYNCCDDIYTYIGSEYTIEELNEALGKQAKNPLFIKVVIRYISVAMCSV
jgi:hypothetical protein